VVFETCNGVITLFTHRKTAEIKNGDNID